MLFQELADLHVGFGGQPCRCVDATGGYWNCSAKVEPLRVTELICGRRSDRDLTHGSTNEIWVP
eukprot:12430686-Karenia_brevis.AAC.1